MPDRRHFLRSSLFLSLAASPLAAQVEKPNSSSDDSLAAEVETRLALLLARHGDKLDDDARKAIRADLESMVKRARRLREFPLTNADGPSLILVPYRAPAE